MYRVYNSGTITDTTSGINQEVESYMGQVAGYATGYIRTLCGMAQSVTAQRLLGNQTDSFTELNDNGTTQKSLYVDSNGVSTATGESDFTVLSVLNTDWTDTFQSNPVPSCWTSVTGAAFPTLRWEQSSL